METYTELKELVDNPDFQSQKQRIQHGLTDNMIDRPIVDLIRGFNKLSFCFTLQSCYGHFVYEGQRDPENLAPLQPSELSSNVSYRIAYMVFGIENSAAGKDLLNALKKTVSIDPEYIQLCCADWFWDRQVNSYVLQVEPRRFKCSDTADVDYREAIHLERVKSQLFLRLHELLDRLKMIQMSDA